MVYITEHAVRGINLKQLYLRNLMSENKAHQCMGQLMYRCAYKPGRITHQPRFIAEAGIKQLIARSDHYAEQTEQSGGERHVQKIEDKNVKSRIHSLCCRFNSEDCCSSMSTPSMQS